MLERNDNPLRKVTIIVTTEYDPKKATVEKLKFAMIGALGWMEGVGEVQAEEKLK